jgi:tetratricopeptide (TPR) repeat protein
MLALNADGKRYLDRIIPLIAQDTPAEVAARVLSQAAGMLVRARDPAGLVYAQRAAELYRQLGDPVGLGTVLAGIGIYRANQQRHAEALAALEEARELLGNTKFWKRQLLVLTGLGLTAEGSGDHDAAGHYHRQALDVAGAGSYEPVLLSNLANHEFIIGNVARAIEIGREAIVRLRGSPDRKGLRDLMVNQAFYLLHVGDVEEARFFAEEAFSCAGKANFPSSSELLLWAVLSAFEGRLIEAARLLGVVDAELERLGEPVDPMERPLYEEVGRRLDAVLPPNELDALKAEGARWTVAKALEFVSTCLLLPPPAP